MVKGIRPLAICLKKGLYRVYYPSRKCICENCWNSQSESVSQIPASPKKAFSSLQFLEFLLLERAVYALPFL